MGFISIAADMTGVRAALERIASALERLSPPLPAPAAAPEGREWDAGPPEFHLAESPEEYKARTDSEAALAVSLGFAPWSPAFQETIAQMRRDLMKPAQDRGADGNLVATEGLSEEEAERTIQDAFRIAKAEANTRD